MAYLISFKTARFDVRAETPNPVNPIAGRSVLVWLRTALVNAGYQATEPGTEDWGWYMDVQGASGSYLVGASGDAESVERQVEWVVQIHKHRSLTDRLRGRNVLSDADALLSVIEDAVRGDTEILDVTVERGA